ncbi:hypothetical protein APHAL10511_006423 [Amanita phalloides]|nr:hypothetical protein APHAL10511_006423 [Amanita phalloides]
MFEAYADAFATATDTVVMICFMSAKKHFIEFKLPPTLEANANAPIPSDSVRLAWLLSPKLPYEPLLVVSRLHTVYILNTSNPGPFSYLVGHGGAITSIAVHPTRPHIFATTSRDFTTRIYDTTLSPRQTEDEKHNPVWPPSKFPSHAGPPFGLIGNQKEGVGMGRCVVLLMGGRSGGHKAAVLGAAFHSSKPLIATCGLDRAVKIWALPPAINSLQLARLDKPLFGGTSVHRARVLSINWLSDNILLSHNAPTVLCTKLDENGKAKYTMDAGELVLWRWLSLDRFFPQDLQTYRQTVRPTYRDWEDSRSFEVLFKKSIPGELSPSSGPMLAMYPYQSTSGNVIVMIYPESTSFFLLHLPDSFKQCEMPKFPLDSGEASGKGGSDKLPGWSISTEEGSVQKLNACGILRNGNMIVGVGTQGTIWIWTIK